jgi:hypothetical protein
MFAETVVREEYTRPVCREPVEYTARIDDALHAIGTASKEWAGGFIGLRRAVCRGWGFGASDKV